MSDPVSRLNAALAGRYRVVRELGQGGMAAVYLADDLRHGRQVAIKVMKPELASVVGAERFLNEIRLTAGLQHPHILALYDSGDADSFLYYVMPYVEGESLRDRLNREGALPVPEAVEILEELADGLAYAEDRGVVHRDIKPDNVLLSGRHALLADLGISKAVASTTDRGQLTTVGFALGTPEYMAPEQVAAEPDVDHRADVYALGVVAYEMLTGTTPFAGRSAQQVLSAHVVETPRNVTDRSSELPPGLGPLVMKCLEKSAADRWQSAEDLLRELLLVERGQPSEGVEGDAAGMGVGFGGTRSAMVVFAVTVLAAMSIWTLSTLSSPGVTERNRIAVLPFDNLGGADDEYFSEGVTRDTNTRIAKIGSFAVIAHGSARQAKASGQSYLEMVEQLGVHYVVEGSVSRSGDRVLVTAALIDPVTSEQIWNEQYDRELSAEHIFTIRGDVAQEVARSLDVTLSPEQEAALSERPTDNLEAYQEYLLGLFFWEKRTVEAFTSAVRHFERAIELDSAYAMAYAGLADVHLVRPWFSAEYSNREGLILADSLARRAIEVDPLSPILSQDVGYVLKLARNGQASLEQYERTVELHPEFSTTVLGLAWSYVDEGRFDEARSMAVRWAGLTGNDAAYVQQVIDLTARYAETGQPQLPTGPDLGSVFPPYGMAPLYARLGQYQQALDFLERGYEEGAFGVVASMLSPALDVLRSHPRVLALMEKTGLAF